MNKTLRRGFQKTLDIWLLGCLWSSQNASDSRSCDTGLLVPPIVFSCNRYRPDPVRASDSHTTTWQREIEVCYLPVAKHIAKPTTQSRRMTPEGSTSSVGTKYSLRAINFANLRQHKPCRIEKLTCCGSAAGYCLN